MDNTNLFGSPYPFPGALHCRKIHLHFGFRGFIPWIIGATIRPVIFSTSACFVNLNIVSISIDLIIASAIVSIMLIIVRMAALEFSGVWVIRWLC